LATKTFAARIGGDEFALLLRGKDERGAMQMIERIRKLIDVNNQFYQGPPLGMSLGASTTDDRKTFAQAYKEADDRMYADKRSGAASRRPGVGNAGGAALA
jgi:diguanylate cyclase (GGDEF)-like protein